MGAGRSGNYKGTKGAENKQITYNSAGSSLVKTVNSLISLENIKKLPMIASPNSVSLKYKNGKLLSERYYDANGKAYLDIDYTNHGNSKTHPNVPHQHIIKFNDQGESIRGKDMKI